jgi:hypothetical protein
MSMGRFMNTKPIIHVGIALFLLGSATLTYHGLPYTSPDKVVDADHSQARADGPLSPLLGGLLLGGGILLIALGVKKSPEHG